MKSVTGGFFPVKVRIYLVTGNLLPVKGIKNNTLCHNTFFQWMEEYFWSLEMNFLSQEEQRTPRSVLTLYLTLINATYFYYYLTRGLGLKEVTSCSREVVKVFQGNFKVVSRELQGWFKEISRADQASFKGLQEGVNDVSRGFLVKGVPECSSFLKKAGLVPLFVTYFWAAPLVKRSKDEKLDHKLDEHW